MISSPEAASAPVPRQALTSSLGIIDDYIAKSYPLRLGSTSTTVQITDSRFRQDVMAGMAGIYYYTFQGKLILTYAYNAGHWTEEMIMGIMRDMRVILLKGLAEGDREERIVV